MIKIQRSVLLSLCLLCAIGVDATASSSSRPSECPDPDPPVIAGLPIDTVYFDVDEEDGCNEKHDVPIPTSVTDVNGVSSSGYFYNFEETYNPGMFEYGDGIGIPNPLEINIEVATYIISFWAQDECGNRDTASYVAVGLDARPPEITDNYPFPNLGSGSVYAPMDSCALYPYGDVLETLRPALPDAFDECDSSPILDIIIYSNTDVIVYEDVPMGSSPDLELLPGDITIEHSIYDAFYNYTTILSYITVIDTFPPVIVNPPADLTIANTPGQCNAAIDFVMPDVIDNCDPNISITVVISGGGFPPVQYGGYQPGDTLSFSSFAVGDWTIEYYAFDLNNSSSVTQQFTVEDFENPEIYPIPLDTLIFADNNCLGNYNVQLPDVYDNCDISGADLVVTVNYAPELMISPDIYNLAPLDNLNIALNPGLYAIDYQTWDVSGNNTIVTNYISVIDITPPVIAFTPPDVTISDDDGNCSESYLLNIPDVTDNCVGIDEYTLYVDNSFPYSIPGLSAGPQEIAVSVGYTGINTLTLEAIDSSGNVSYVQFTIFVEDPEPPVVDCVPLVSTSTEDGFCSKQLVLSVPSVSEFCAPFIDVFVSVDISFSNGESESFSEISGYIFERSYPLGISFVEYTFYDGQNFGTCTTVVEVLDLQPPFFSSCPADAVIGTSSLPGTCTGEIQITHPSVSDNCDIGAYTISISGPDGTFSNLPIGAPDTTLILTTGSTSILYTATDGSGLSEFCNYSIDVEDDSPPEVAGVFPSELVGQCGLDTPDELIEANFPEITDDCGEAFYILVDTDSSTPCDGEQVITNYYVLEDENGNQSVDVFATTIIIRDTISPELQDIPNDLVLSCLAPDIPIAFQNVTATDLCLGATSVELQIDTFNYNPLEDTLAKYIYHWFAEDACGNDIEAERTISVLNDFAIEIADEDGFPLNELISICEGESIELFTSPQGSSYQWSTGETTPSILVSEGTYSVTVTTEFGCTASDEVEVFVESAITFNLDTIGSFDCGEESVIIFVNSSQTIESYQWNTGETTDSIVAGSAGQYIVTITPFASSCSLSDSILIDSGSDVPSIDITGDTVINCINLSTTLMIETDAPDPTYEWYFENNFIGSDQALLVEEAGTYLAIVTSADCSSFQEKVVTGSTEFGFPDVQIMADILNCLNAQVEIEVTGITGPATYSWEGPSGFVSTDANPVIVQSGQYDVTITDENMCNAEYSIEVMADLTVPTAMAEATPSSVINCNDDAISLTSTLAPNEVASWTKLNGQPIDATVPITETGIFILTVTNQLSQCSVSDTLEITQDTLTPILAPTSTLNCAQSVIILNSNPDISNARYEWSGPGGFTSTEAQPEISKAGDYVVEVQNLDNGCVSTAQVTVERDVALADIEISIIPARNGNNGTAWIDPETFVGIPPFTYSWDTGTPSVSGDTVTMISAGPHYLEVVDGNDCITRIDYYMDAVTSICDYATIPVSVATRLMDTLNAGRRAPESLIDQPCVQDAYGGVIPANLRVQTYIYATIADSAILSFSSEGALTRALVMTCEEFENFSLASCLFATPTAQSNEIPFYTTEPFYYIVILGISNTPFEFEILLDEPVRTVCGSGEFLLNCFEPMQGFLDGTDDFNLLDRSTSDYLNCYNGSRQYDGADIVYEFHLDRPTASVFTIEAETDMGAFIYDFQCTERCLSYFETTSEDQEVTDTILLNAGTYYIVIDAATPADAGEYTLIAECLRFDGFPWPDRRQPTQFICYDSVNTHILEYGPGSFDFSDDLSENDNYYVHFLSPNAQYQIGNERRIFPNSGGVLDAFPDIDGDLDTCGYIENELITMRMTNTSKQEVFILEASYNSGGGRFQINGLSGIDRFAAEGGRPYTNIIHPTNFKGQEWDDLTVDFDIVTNETWSTDTTTYPDWINSVDFICDTAGIGNVCVNLTIDTNKTELPREARLEFIFEKTNVTKEYILVQNPKRVNEDTTSSTSRLEIWTPQVQVIPNPNNGEFSVMYDFEQPREFELSIVNPVGQLIWKTDKLTGLRGTEYVQVSNMSSGVYFLKITSEGRYFVGKVIIE